MTEQKVIEKLKIEKNKIIREQSCFRNILILAADIIPPAEKNFLNKKINDCEETLKYITGGINILEKKVIK